MVAMRIPVTGLPCIRQTGRNLPCERLGAYRFFWMSKAILNYLQKPFQMSLTFFHPDV